ncbi:MAG TPA: condensation domain-containing protein, partial [Pilimelia sp.]|nr:condensation domain-containing protein [Pilimelia sp.]
MTELAGVDVAIRERLIRQLLTRRGLAAEQERIPRREPGAVVPLSPLQEGLWFLSGLQPHNSAYVMLWSARLTGPLDAAVLQRALDAVVARHEALRTHLAAAGSRGATQVVLPPGDPRTRVQMRPVDLSGVPPAELDDAINRTVLDTIDAAAGIASCPLPRATLARVSDVEHVVALAVQHIVVDDRSLRVVVRELFDCYAALRRGAEWIAPPPACQYPDYAVWLRRRLRTESGLERQRRYWAERLAGATGGVDLPTDRPRPAVMTLRGAARSYPVPAKLRHGLDALGARLGATRFMVMLAGLQALLARLSGQDDICVGSPFTLRSRPELAEAVGLFVNSLPLRTDLSGD